MLLKTPRSRNQLPSDSKQNSVAKSSKHTPTPYIFKEQRLSFLNKPTQILQLDLDLPQRDINNNQQSAIQSGIKDLSKKDKAYHAINAHSQGSNNIHIGLKKAQKKSRTCEIHLNFGQLSLSHKKDSQILTKFIPENSQLQNSNDKVSLLKVARENKMLLEIPQQLNSAKKRLILSPATKQRLNEDNVNEQYYDIKMLKTTTQISNRNSIGALSNSQLQIMENVESDYISNIHLVRDGHHYSNSVSRRQSRTAKRPVVKVEMDLENNSLLLIKPVPSSRNKSQRAQSSFDRSILKRSLSQSAKVLASKANSLREGDRLLSPVGGLQYLSPKPPDKFKLSGVLKVVELKI